MWGRGCRVATTAESRDWGAIGAQNKRRSSARPSLHVSLRPLLQPLGGGQEGVLDVASSKLANEVGLLFG